MIEAPYSVAPAYSPENDVTLFRGDCADLLDSIPDESAQLVITSPPYNIGKEYESELTMQDYVAWQVEVVEKCIRILEPGGSLCWQVGNHVRHVNKATAITPLDTILWERFVNLGLTPRNRIIWAFEHGAHCTLRFSGRHEVVMWFTKTDGNDYIFNLDAVRVPQKYPGKKAFKGPKAGMYSGNPLGKNPGDFWLIPNVKSNHVEKTAHPCQFPIELVERFVLSMTEEGSLVVDPFAGSGSTLIAAAKNGRRSAGAEVDKGYCDIVAERIEKLNRGELKMRKMGTPVHTPSGKLSINPWNPNVAKNT